MEEITDAKEENKPSVGEEFIRWAEQYWGLSKKYVQTHSGTNGPESHDYESIRNIFSQKIDEIVKRRIDGN